MEYAVESVAVSVTASPRNTWNNQKMVKSSSSRKCPVSNYEADYGPPHGAQVAHQSAIVEPTSHGESRVRFVETSSCSIQLSVSCEPREFTKKKKTCQSRSRSEPENEGNIFSNERGFEANAVRRRSSEPADWVGHGMRCKALPRAGGPWEHFSSSSCHRIRQNNRKMTCLTCHNGHLRLEGYFFGANLYLFLCLVLISLINVSDGYPVTDEHSLGGLADSASSHLISSHLISSVGFFFFFRCQFRCFFLSFFTRLKDLIVLVFFFGAGGKTV